MIWKIKDCKIYKLIICLNSTKFLENDTFWGKGFTEMGKC